MLDQLANTGFLGLIQGLTEWLPVSSTGHLRIISHYLNLATTPLFNIILHIGTLLVVLFYFREDIKNILAALVHRDFKSETGQLIPAIIIATIPTAAIGLLYVVFLEDTFLTVQTISIAFLVGATLVYISKQGKETIYTVTVTIALIVGVAQGFAIFPGLSRSGATISTALLLGLKRETAFKFSFLLSVPAILGDLMVEFYKQRGQLSMSGIGWSETLIGITMAIVASYIAIRLVSKTVFSRKFHYFAFYTWTLGIVLLVLTSSWL